MLRPVRKRPRRSRQPRQSPAAATRRSTPPPPRRRRVRPHSLIKGLVESLPVAFPREDFCCTDVAAYWQLSISTNELHRAQIALSEDAPSRPDVAIRPRPGRGPEHSRPTLNSWIPTHRKKRRFPSGLRHLE